MKAWKSKVVFAALLVALTAGADAAQPADQNKAFASAAVNVDASLIVPVSGGCGPRGWRGPWGGCRYTPYYGPLPGGYYQEYPIVRNNCPPGYWRGPWGHCRNTPYHGRLPDGSWK